MKRLLSIMGLITLTLVHRGSDGVSERRKKIYGRIEESE
jgi:hypothetical protein